MAVEEVQRKKHRGRKREKEREKKSTRESKPTIIGVVILITTKEKNCLMSKHTLVAVSSRFSYYFWLSGRTCICLTKKKNFVCVCACPRLSKREKERVIKTVDQIVILLFIITKNIRSSTPSSSSSSSPSSRFLCYTPASLPICFTWLIVAMLLLFLFSSLCYWNHEWSLWY